MANIKITFQLKRDTAAKWSKHNPILGEGEPGYVTDENRLKIGDGVTAWNDLAYVGENSVVNAQTHYDFPSIGRENVIYKAESEKKIYQWNASALKYEEVSVCEGSTGVTDIELINGGGAIIE